MKEHWKEIIGFNGKYKISNFGNIKTTRVCKSTGCNYMTPFLTKSSGSKRGAGYFRICLTMPDGRQKKFQVHRLVAEAFIPNPDNKPHINHINSIRHDNRVDNLEWCTPSENYNHTKRMGRLKISKGNNHYNSKLDELKVKEIKRLLEGGDVSMYRIAKNFGVNKVTVFDIKYGNTWKDV